MAAKIFAYSSSALDGTNVYWFHCPGCGNSHGFTVGGVEGIAAKWSWNGSYEAPTFYPSLLCNKDYPESRCHSWVKDGKIQFLQDCWHSLKGQTVELPDWE